MVPVAHGHPAFTATEHAPSAGDVHWAQPEPGFWVASRCGDFVGTVTTEGSSFIARDATGSLAGEHDSLVAAQASLTIEDPARAS